MKPRHLLTILALSPQASSLHDAVNYPVDGNKGAADILIPLYTVPDPMAEKYYGVNTYGYCAGNPVMMVDTNGKEWRDSKGNKIVDHSNIHVYIFYDPKSFKRQSNKMYHDAVVKDGIDKEPFPGHSWMRRTWDYLWRPSYQRNSGVGLPSK